MKRTVQFSLGQIVATRHLLEVINPEDMHIALVKHSHGDWGICCNDDKQANDLALENGGRIVSIYRDRNKKKFWIITEADRSATTVLLPEDY